MTLSYKKIGAINQAFIYINSVITIIKKEKK